MRNKLPGYILPVLPAWAALAGIALRDTPRARAWLAACALASAVFPIAAQLLPTAIMNGLSHAQKPAFHPVWLAPLPLAVMAWLLDRRGRRLAAVLTVAGGTALAIAALKVVTVPQLDQSVSARGLWRRIQPDVANVCVGDLKRDSIYGLNYYAGYALPRCQEDDLRMHLR
jgi:hypothetical protein